MDTIADVAADLSTTVATARDQRSERDACWSIIVQFIDDFARANDASRVQTVANRPSTTGSHRWDAFVAALTEHLCRLHGVRVPRWALDQAYVLEEWWFPSGYESLHATALVESPASFAVRGIFLTGGALARR